MSMRVQQPKSFRGVLGFSLVTLVTLVACTDALPSSASDAAVPAMHVHTHTHGAGAARFDAAQVDNADDAGAVDAGAPSYAWRLPAGFPLPKLPSEDSMSDAKVELGRHLFYERRLSGNETQSCGSCHQQERAFTDGRAVAIGSTGQAHVRSAMSLANVAYSATLTWANPLLRTLERQALVPLFGETPVELGLSGMDDSVLERLRKDTRYAQLFAAAFSGDLDPISVDHITIAIAAFERTLLSGDSAYDRYAYQRDATALSGSAMRGMDLFFSERLECFHCHGGFNFSDSVTHEGSAFTETPFHNTALYNLDGQGAYPPDNIGLLAFTGEVRDMGRFKAPTLRNIAVTAPYMHDGSIATLEEVVDHYARGGRTITSGSLAGVGSKSPLRSEFITGFQISASEKRELVAFLESLTDTTFLSDPRFADPGQASP